MNDPTPAAAPQLLTIPQVAGRLQVSKQTIYKLIAEGHLKAMNVAPWSKVSKMRVAEDHLAEFIKAGQDHGEPAGSTVP